MNVASIIDTHAHLNMSFDKDLAETISRATDAGVTQIITVGTDMESSKKAVELSKRYDGVYAAVGIHPHDVTAITMADIDSLGTIAMHPRVVAIGETGLDFYRNISPQDKQKIVFLWQLDLAKELGLPVIIHCRQAAEEMLELLSNRLTDYPGAVQYRGVIHCFNGDAATAKQYLDMGFYISLGGYIGYPKSTGLHEVIRSIPKDRLLVETDCPFLPPQNYRGNRNEPAYLTLTVKALAEIMSASYEDIAAATTQNARRLFGLPLDKS